MTLCLLYREVRSSGIEICNVVYFVHRWALSYLWNTCTMPAQGPYLPCERPAQRVQLPCGCPVSRLYKVVELPCTGRVLHRVCKYVPCGPYTRRIVSVFDLVVFSR
jgi:hypothetical protein